MDDCTLTATVEGLDISGTVEQEEIYADIGFGVPALPDYFRWRQERFDPYFHLPLNDPPGSTVAKALAGPDGTHVSFGDFPPGTVYPDSAPSPSPFNVESLQDGPPFPIAGAPSVIPGYPHLTSTRYMTPEGAANRGSDTYVGDGYTFDFIHTTGIFTICWWAIYRGERDWGPGTSPATTRRPGFVAEVRPSNRRIVCRFKNFDVNVEAGGNQFLIPPGRSTHFCITGEAGDVKLYLNGIQSGRIDESNFPFYNGPSAQPLYIAGQGYCNGDLAGVLIDTRPWSPEEVQKDYYAGLGIYKEEQQ